MNLIKLLIFIYYCDTIEQNKESIVGCGPDGGAGIESIVGTKSKKWFELVRRRAKSCKKDRERNITTMSIYNVRKICKLSHKNQRIHTKIEHSLS
jgi:hypothetical protein